MKPREMDFIPAEIFSTPGINKERRMKFALVVTVFSLLRNFEIKLFNRTKIRYFSSSGKRTMEENRKARPGESRPFERDKKGRRDRRTKKRYLTRCRNNVKMTGRISRELKWVRLIWARKKERARIIAQHSGHGIGLAQSGFVSEKGWGGFLSLGERAELTSERRKTSEACEEKRGHE